MKSIFDGMAAFINLLVFFGLIGFASVIFGMVYGIIYLCNHIHIEWIK